MSNEDIRARHQPSELRLTDGTLIAGGDYCVCGVVLPCDAVKLLARLDAVEKRAEMAADWQEELARKFAEDILAVLEGE